MTDTELIDSENAPSASGQAGRPSGAAELASMRLTELRSLAGRMGIKGTSGLRKGQLLETIVRHQAPAPEGDGGGDVVKQKNRASAAKGGSGSSESVGRGHIADTSAAAAQTGPPDTPKAPADKAEEGTGGFKPGVVAGHDVTGDAGHDAGTSLAGDGGERTSPQSHDQQQKNRGDGSAAGDRQESGPDKEQASQQGRNGGKQQNGGKGQNGGKQQNGGKGQNGGKQQDPEKQQGGQQPRSDAGRSGTDEGDGGGKRGRRFRERRRGGRDRGDRGDGNGSNTTLREDDIVQPVAGIVDVLDNYAFVRTSGYLAGAEDVYVSMNMIRKNGLRRGDAITGAVRVPRQNDRPNQRQKFNPLVRLDTVNGQPVDDAKKRPEFSKLTPLYPNQRLRLETDASQLTTRVIDLVMPIGKGQRALIVSPPKAGKTTILQGIANAIATNNPECHLMVVLVDERPEEVTDMQRSVRGEVIASTFDRPPSDHTSVAELAIERAKRLVEMGQDVVVLLDSITRLGRAYNNSSPASGRILSGGVDSTALYPPKRFLGAARNIEEGGSLTIIATAMVETGSQGDTVIFEEFKGTGNAELKLDRKIAERRVFPAVDVNPSGTRRDDLLFTPEEAAVVHRLRRVMSGLDSHQAIDVLLEQLKKSRNNYEFLMQTSKTALGAVPE